MTFDISIITITITIYIYIYAFLFIIIHIYQYIIWYSGKTLEKTMRLCQLKKLGNNSVELFGPAGPTIPQHIKQIKRLLNTRIVHTSGTFFEKISKNTFKQCSHIESNTPNPNTIFKITIYCTRYTKHTKIRSKKQTNIVSVFFFENFETLQHL